MTALTDNAKLMQSIDWQKANGLIPAIVQSQATKQVLMLGYMNQDALKKTLETGLVTFWSRTKARIWVKGESSKHYLHLQHIALDCDQDTLLIQAIPQGPTCHLGTQSCFDQRSNSTQDQSVDFSFLQELEALIASRYTQGNSASYTSALFAQGTQRIAQKVGEEGLEVALAAMSKNKKDVLYESADLLYHLLVLLKDQHCSLNEVIHELASRHRK